jgi:hypothetical protein
MVSIAQAGWPGFNSQQGKKRFLLFRASRPALRPTEPPIQWGLEFFPQGKNSLGMKQSTSLHLVPKSRATPSQCHISSWHSA